MSWMRFEDLSAEIQNEVFEFTASLMYPDESEQVDSDVYDVACSKVYCVTEKDGRTMIESMPV